MDQTTPVTAPALNIDNMLAGLSTHTDEVVQQDSNTVPTTPTDLSQPMENTPVELTPAPTASTGATFSIDSLTKPTNPAPQTEINPNTASQNTNTINPSKLKNILKNVLPIVMTVSLVVVAWWVISVQYPLETKSFFDGIFGVVDTMSQNTKQALESDEIIVWEDAVNEIAMIEVHNAASDPVINYDVDTPLADRMDFVNTQAELPSSQDTLLGEIAGEITSGTLEEIVETDDAISSLPTLQQLQSDLITLSQQAEEAMTQLVGWNPSKQARVKIVYNNSQSMLTTLSQTQTVTEVMVNDFVTLQSIYDDLLQ